MPFDEESLRSAINELLVKEFELDLAAVTPQADLYDDFDIDSLDGIDMIVAIEKRFNVRVNEKRGMKTRTVEDVYRLARSILEENGIDTIPSL